MIAVYIAVAVLSLVYVVECTKLCRHSNKYRILANGRKYDSVNEVPPIQ